jgi:serine/threonine protein kinase/tetratricopeptide (TPR) repeat protein
MAETGGTRVAPSRSEVERASPESEMSTSTQDETSAVVQGDDTVASLASGSSPERSDSGESAPAALAEPAVTRIGRYEVRSVLGRGGMGCVHCAFDPVLEREVALKVMRAEIVDDPEQKQRFEREARAVARLSHPGVVTVFDLGYHTDGSPYIVMELLRGQDLLARMRAEPPLSLEQKVSIIGQVLDGLGHAHRTGIVHRDIKPANVFLTEDGSARIMDFGLAFFTSSGATSRSVMGTVAYMSTEQVRGERVDGRSDLFSVGTMLCEMLTGRRPFEGDTPAATLYRIAHDEPRIDLSSASERPFLTVLKRALARKAAERYQTAAEFATELRACLEHARASSVERAPVVPSPAASPSPTASSAVPAATPPVSHRKADPSGLFKLLRQIYVGGRTGQLHFSMGGQRKSLRILKGRILHGTSDANGEHLGDVLVRYGLLGQADLERAVAVVLRERKRLGAVLSETGLLEVDALQEAVGIHVREILFSALDQADVAFNFEDLAESSLETDLVCPQSMGQVILEATRRVFDPALVRRLLGETSRVLTLSPDPLLRSQKITLTPADGFVLSRVDGTLSARDVMDLSPLSEEDTERSLFSLLCTGTIGYREEVTGRQASGQTTVPPTRRVPPPAAASPSSPLPRSERAPSPSPVAATLTPPTAPTPTAPTVAAIGTAEIRAILEASARSRRDPFEVLGVEPTADEAEIRGAYARLARVLHPDVVLDPSLDDLRGLREAAFVQLGQAVDTLRSPGFRQYAAERAARARPRPTPAPASAPVPTPAPTPTPTPTLTPTPDASAASRPARVPPVSEAPAPPVAPGDQVRAARRHFEAERYWEAIQLLEPALPHAEGATRSEARLLLAQSYLKNPRWKKRAEEMVLDLVRENPQLVAARLLLAEIYRSSGLHARARAAYQKVLALQPGNETATQGLAETEPSPKENPSPSRLRGLFSRR